MTRVHTRYARSGTCHIAYQAVGQGSVDVVFLPGFPSNIDILWEDAGFARLMRRLSAFARVLVVNRRGTGVSDAFDHGRRPDLDDHAGDVLAVMTAAGSTRAALLAASDDVPSAIAFAVRHPDRTRCLVLYGGQPARRDHAAERPASGAGQPLPMSLWGRGETARQFAAGRAGDTAFVFWWARLERLSASPATAGMIMSAEAATDVTALLPDVVAPTLVMHRRKDSWVPYALGARLAAGIKGARLVDLQGRDHTIWIGAVDEIGDQVELFVTGSKKPVTGRILATLLVLRIVNAERMAANLGAFGWREMEERLSAIVGRLSGDHDHKRLPAIAGELRFQFNRPSQAIMYAEALRRDVRGMSLHVGIGIHTGEFDANESGLAGLGTLIAERIAAAATRDEILVSSAIVDLILGSGVRSRPAGAVKIDGLETPICISRIEEEQHLEPAPKTTDPDLESLTARELQVLRYVARGLSNASVGLELGISEHTVKRHVANILDKLDLPSRAAAAGLAARNVL